MRDIGKLTCVEPAVREAQKEKFMCLLQEVERKRADVLPEHQKIQKRSQKLQSLQEKQKHCLKEACASEEAMQKTRLGYGKVASVLSGLYGEVG